jgi:DNA-binding response OmpR family regulator
MHALICEDDPSIRALVQTVLRREGFEVDVAAEGFGAMQALEKKCFDVIVLDLMMPGVDGRAVVERVKDKWPERLPQIVIMTAVSDALREQFPEPVCTVLPKPFDIDKLASVVHDCARGCGKG